MVPSSILKELHAEARTFKTVAGALRWYMDMRWAALSLEATMEVAAAAINQEQVDQKHSTMAKIAYCLRRHDPEVDDCVLLHVDKLPDWCRGWTDPETLAKLWGFRDEQELRSTMIETEIFLRHRMQARGLLRIGY